MLCLWHNHPVGEQSDCSLYLCIACRGPYISAIGRCYCVDHFTCSKCSVNLVDCGFVEENGKLYCERDFEQFLAPHCAKCSEAILKVRKIERIINESYSIVLSRNAFMHWRKPGIQNVLHALHARNPLVLAHFMSKKVNRIVLKVKLVYQRGEEENCLCRLSSDVPSEMYQLRVSY